VLSWKRQLVVPPRGLYVVGCLGLEAPGLQTAMPSSIRCSPSSNCSIRSLLVLVISRLVNNLALIPISPSKYSTINVCFSSGEKVPQILDTD